MESLDDGYKRERVGMYCNDAHDNRRHGKHDRVEDQRPPDVPQHPLVVHDEVQPRVQHPALRDDHDEPRQVDHGDGAEEVLPQAKVGEEDEERLQDDAPGHERARPEVQALAPLEHHEERDVDLQPDVPGHAGKGGHGHGHGEVVADVIHGDVLGMCRW